MLKLPYTVKVTGKLPPVKLAPGRLPPPNKFFPGLVLWFGLGLGWGAIFRGQSSRGAIFLVPLVKTLNQFRTT